MLFNSLSFLIFFPLVTALYFLLPHKYRWFLLLAASCYFYMGFIPKYILILAFTITVDYFAGIFIEKAVSRRKKIYLCVSIIANIGVLFIFKYFNFFNANLASLASFLHWNYPLRFLSLVLPIGLSFHTFQSLAYTIEVYRGRQKAERNFGILALYVMFYPQLVAGPIERPQNLLHQFREKHNWEWPRIFSGLELMLWGFFKKIVIADSLASYVNSVYGNITHFQAPALIIATIFFSFQIYCDFSGYSDIAIGSARVMGFKLMDNFRQPYFSRSISEFWHRWHISLSTWFKDYVYIPLGGSRIGKKRHIANLIVVFLLSGVWHGANWTYVLWGLINGSFIVLSVFFNNFKQKLLILMKTRFLLNIYHFYQIITTFILISLAWVFFRADTVSDAFKIIYRMFTGWNLLYYSTSNFFINYIFIGFSSRYFFGALFGIILLIVAEIMQVNNWLKLICNKANLWYYNFAKYTLHWFLISSAILLMIILNSKVESHPFIYFQF